MFGVLENVSAISAGCMLIQCAWLCCSAWVFLHRNDDFPLVASLFLAYCGSYRMAAAHLGWFEWRDLGYGLDISIDAAGLDQAFGMIVLGQSVLLFCYVRVQRENIVLREEHLPVVLRSRLRMLIWGMAAIAIPAAIVSRSYLSAQVAAGKSLAFEVSSYVLLLPMVLISLIMLICLGLRFRLVRAPVEVALAVALLVVVGIVTFGPTGRFKLLGGVVGGIYVLSTYWRGSRRLAVLACGGLLAVFLFSLAGALRGHGEGDLVEGGWVRTKRGEDANFLNGMVYIMKVYPDLLPYRYGGEHLEVLARPIPRALWPGKPVGGYMNKLGVFGAQGGRTVGFSPTLFGSFHAEGGIAGIVMFSLLYGWGIGRLVRYSNRLHPLFAVAVRGCLVAGVIPLLRGGDLPGVYAWLGMAFAPILVFFWWDAKYLRSTAFIGLRRKARNSKLRQTLLSKTAKGKSKAEMPGV